MTDDTDKLADKLSSLSMTSRSNNLTVVEEISEHRTVTLPMTADENIPLRTVGSEKQERLSIEQMGPGSTSSRPSFDSHTQSGDLSQHLMGHSPRMKVGRPPKGTIMTYRCSNDGAENVGNMVHRRTPISENLCFVTTYVILCLSDLTKSVYTASNNSSSTLFL